MPYGYSIFRVKITFNKGIFAALLWSIIFVFLYLYQQSGRWLLMWDDFTDKEKQDIRSDLPGTSAGNWRNFIHCPQQNALSFKCLSNELALALWLVPSWSKEEKTSYSMINAGWICPGSFFKVAWGCQYGKRNWARLILKLFKCLKKRRGLIGERNEHIIADHIVVLVILVFSVVYLTLIC